MLIQPMLQRLQAARSLEDTLQVALADVVALHGAERGSLQLFDSQGDLAVVSHVGLSRAFLQLFSRVKLGAGTVCERAAVCRQTVFVPDIEQDAPFGPYRAFARTVPFRAVLSSPLLRAGRSVGVISAHFANPFKPSSLELQSLETYCGHVAEAICAWQDEAALGRSADRLAAALLQ